MSSTEVGSLHYDLDIPLDKLESSLDKGEKDVKAFSERLHDGLTKAAKGFAVVGAGLTLISKNATDFTVDLVTQSKTLGRQIGVSTEEASRLTAAFSRMGVSAENASTMFGAFSKNIVESTKKGVNDTSDAFGRLGIKTVDAQNKQKDFNTLLFEVADKFKTLPNGIDKTALSMELFGRSGKDMINVLNLGSTGIQDLEKQADKLGVTLTSNTISKIQDYVKSQKDLKESTDAVKIAIGTATAPVLTDFNKALNDVILSMVGTDGPLKDATVNFIAFGGPVAAGVSAVIAFAANLVTAWPIIAATTTRIWAMTVATTAAVLPYILIGAAIAALAYLVITNWDTIVNVVGGAVNKINEFIFNLKDRAWEALLNIASFFTNLPIRIRDALQNLAIMLYSAGSDLISGMINGIRDRLGALGKTLSDGVKAAVGQVKSLLGIHSPSTVFQDIGKNVTAGFVKGINDSSRLAMGAMDKLAGNVISPVLNVSPAAQNTSQQPLASTAGNTNINIGQINDKSDADYIFSRMNRSYERVAMGISS